MLDLTFFTSNRVKLAHARYLAEGIPVRLKGFHERTYHATYNEPRLASRNELLEASYRSAVEQSRKAGLLTKRHFFILEDTSVSIAALSSDGREVPGLDIKYWMREATFTSLDSSIRAAGGNRLATVRSDIVLHIPDDYKARWGITDDYLVFVGEQEGTVVEREVSFETNVVFPWLDNASFNKWFVPKGANAPLGQLTLGDARQFDFRRRSFEKLFAFLESKGLLTKPPLQKNLPLGSEKNFIVCGYTCAGKTTASQFLAAGFDYQHVEASDFMYLSYYTRHDYQGQVSIGDFAEKALVVRPEIAAEKIAEFLEEDTGRPSVISGFRSPDEIRWLVEHFAPSGKQFQVVFVTAAEATRFQRMSDRKRGGDVDSLDQFQARDLQQRRMGLDRIAAADDTSTWKNEGTLAAYYHVIESAVGERSQPALDVVNLIASLRDGPAVKLEDAILVTLLSRWKTDERRDYFTTSEIAKLIAELLGAGRAKHKDNVSRYFNQLFYPFYEITSDGGTRKYRLSNTGYGKALSTLRRLTQKVTLPRSSRGRMLTRN